MRARHVIHVVSCHAEGEVGDVIVGGVAPPPGSTLWEQSRFIAEDGWLRDVVLNEPRGGVFRHVNLLVPPVDPAAKMGFVIMEPADTPPMSGSNSLCVATVLLETGILPMEEPETRLVLEAPGGTHRGDGHLPRRQGREGAGPERPVLRGPPRCARLKWRDSAPSRPTPPTAATASSSWTRPRSASPSFPTRRGTSPRPGCASPARRTSSSASGTRSSRIGRTSRSASSRRPSSTGTGSPTAGTRSPSDRGRSTGRPAEPGAPRASRCCTRGACSRRATRSSGVSPIDSRFECRIESEATVGGRPAIVPSLAGRAWITGTHQHTVDPADPWPRGYRLSDTWPRYA